MTWPAIHDDTSNKILVSQIMPLYMQVFIQPILNISQDRIIHLTKLFSFGENNESLV